MSQGLILSKLADIRRKHVGVTATHGLSLLCSCAISAAAVEMFADWLFDLPWAARLLLLIVLASGVIYLVMKHLVRPLVPGPDDDEWALAVEREHPRLGGRLIASVQLARPMAVTPGLSQVMVQATLSQASTLAGELDFGRVVKTEAMKRHAGLGLAVALMGLVLFAWGWPSSGVLLGRMLLSNQPVPRKTRVVPVTMNQRIAVGDDLSLFADAAGLRPSGGTLAIKYHSGGQQDLAVAPVADPNNRFGTTLNNVQESFQFRFTLGDGIGQWYQITVLPRPTLTGISFWQIFPAYTHLQPQKRLGGDLSLLDGSRLIVAVTSSTMLNAADPGEPVSRVHLTGAAASESPLAVDGQNALSSLADVPKAAPGFGAATDANGIAVPTGTNGLSVTLVDTNGMSSKDSVVYPIEVVPPRAPLARILSTDHREQLVTLVATFDIPFEASADYGLGGVALVYKVDGGDEKVVAINLPGGYPKTLKSTYTWQISTIEKAGSTTRPTLEGSTVEYWLRAFDTEPTPLAGNGEHFQLRVVTPEEKRQELLTRAQVIPEVIHQTQTHQEADNSHLGAVIMGEQGATTEPATQPSGAAP